MMSNEIPQVIPRSVRIEKGWSLYVWWVEVVDESWNIDAPITTTNITATGNTVIGNASVDTLTINATTTAVAPITVGVDDTGHDVKFFGATAWKSRLWDESADKMIVTGDASISWTTTVWKVTTAQASTLVPVIIHAVQQALSGAGAVNLTTYYTAVTTTGADALTLADATTAGLMKKIQMIVDGGVWTLTFNTSATIEFADVGDTAELIWDWSDWIPVALYNVVDGATAPAYTPAS